LGSGKSRREEFRRGTTIIMRIIVREPVGIIQSWEK
jgi:hypothetical protein